MRESPEISLLLPARFHGKKDIKDLFHSHQKPNLLIIMKKRFAQHTLADTKW
jgi:hypothetical protein